MNYKKLMLIAVLALVAVISFTKIAPFAADPENHKHTIEQTDERIASVMALSGGAAATSATLISLSGYITFMGLIPLACVFMCIMVATGRRTYSRTAGKIALIGIIIFLIVPASVKLSDMVYQTQATQVNTTIEEYNNLEIEGDSESGLFNEFTTITTETIDRITSFIDNLMESLAVMIVTSCVIPLLVFFFLVWLVKTIFSANILVMESKD